MQDTYFEVISKLGKRVLVTTSRWDMITKRKHPEISGKEEEIRETLRNPDEIRLSKRDATVYLHYKHYDRLSLSVVIKHHNGEGFVVTAYYTDRIKEGKRVYTRQS